MSTFAVAASGAGTRFSCDMTVLGNTTHMRAVVDWRGSIRWPGAGTKVPAYVRLVWCARSVFLRRPELQFGHSEQERR